MREFNVTGLCVPSMHYMADTSEKIRQIMAMVEKGQYFTVNRGRQYGKTTTLSLLEKSLPKEYIVIKVSFEGVDDSVFETPENFCKGILNICAKYFTERNLPGSEVWVDESVTTFDLLDAFLTKTCKNKKIVLMIDEVDYASNNLIFLNFLEIFRKNVALQSIILVGVYGIKNIKSFDVDMSLSEKEIASMLAEYEGDHKNRNGHRIYSQRNQGIYQWLPLPCFQNLPIHRKRF